MDLRLPLLLLSTLLLVDATGVESSTDLRSGSSITLLNADLLRPDRPVGAATALHLSGDVVSGPLGDQTQETNGGGIRLLSGTDQNQDGKREGLISTVVRNLSATDGRWYRLRTRMLVQEGFSVEQDDLFMQVEFFRDGGTNALDHIKQPLFAQALRDRRDLMDPGTNRSLGPATWRHFEVTFRTPFAEVDTLRVSLGFGHGNGTGRQSECWIDQWELTPIAVPATYVQPIPAIVSLGKDAIPTLVPLGGRWYYDPRGGDRTAPKEFTASNADRLLYLSDRLEAPFVGNLSAWLRAGYLDTAGKPVTEDRFVPDQVVITFTPTHLVMRSHNLPNHPTAVFPDRDRSLDGNPNYIQEKLTTSQIPLFPRENPAHLAMEGGTNNNHALPGGPIGIAVNGIVFFNPFDHLLNEDAVWRLDRCCGHPSPNAQYHYHKYPVCVKSPWADDGAAHSPVIGFAFDGFPIYGPYESAGVLAKDDVRRPLNAFNLHHDDERGWHYHVTPGKFPHIIGGFWGVVDIRRPSPPPGGGRQPPRAP